MNGRPLTISRQMPPGWVAQVRAATEERLRRSQGAVARSARLLAPHRLHEIRGLVSRVAPAPR